MDEEQASSIQYDDEVAVQQLPKPTRNKGYEIIADRAINRLSSIFPGTQYSRLDTVYQQGRLRCVTLSCKGKNCKFAIWLRAQLQDGSSWKDETPQVWWFFARRKSMRGQAQGTNWSHSRECRQAQQFVLDYQERLEALEDWIESKLKAGMQHDVLLQRAMEHFEVPSNQSQIVDHIIQRFITDKQPRKSMSLRMPGPVIPVISKAAHPTLAGHVVSTQVRKLYRELAPHLHRKDVQDTLVMLGKGIGIVQSAKSGQNGDYSVQFAPETRSVAITLPAPSPPNQTEVVVSPPNPPASLTK
eukprot:gnl/Dysnectes_brevis/1116_a1247_2707.p1 GENE.gnl/Dysnectes_brevis/1116_a1247_2707~~gnl/Dysnectes_brevis/1116_a1247_2707.p1  ORF type:complete len:300 (-),score=27.43 gnl/Dysnectes_brevis/1116_a1247_2707:82-981(-)